MPQPTRKLWAVVMNATQIRIVKGLGLPGAADGGEIAFAIEPRQLRDIMADKPGRSHASVGDGSRSAMEYSSDPVADATRGLLRQAIEQLSAALTDGAFHELAVYAEPSVLGEWRKLVPPALARTVIRETAANYGHEAPTALRTRLESDLGSAR